MPYRTQVRMSKSRIDQHFEPYEREHLAALRGEMERQGVDDPRKLQATNAGAYAEVEREIEEMDEDPEFRNLPLIERQKKARVIVDERHRRGIFKKTEAELRGEYMGAPTNELMQPGAGPSGGSGARGKRREKPPKQRNKVCAGLERHLQTGDVEVCTECGNLIDKLQDAREAKLQPALWQFAQNCKKEGLHPRHVIAFWLCTPYATREVLDDVAGQIRDFKETAREARRDQLAARERSGDRGLKLKRGDVGLFGEWAGTREPMRLLLSTEHALESSGVKLAPERETGQFAAAIAHHEESLPPNLNHVANAAYAVYFDYLRLLLPRVLDEGGRIVSTTYGLVSNEKVPEAGIEALVTSSIDDCLALCGMLLRGDPLLQILGPHRNGDVDDGSQKRLGNLQSYLCDEKDRFVEKLRRKARKKSGSPEKAQKDAKQKKALDTRLGHRRTKQKVINEYREILDSAAYSALN